MILPTVVQAGNAICDAVARPKRNRKWGHLERKIKPIAKILAEQKRRGVNAYVELDAQTEGRISDAVVTSTLLLATYMRLVSAGQEDSAQSTPTELVDDSKKDLMDGSANDAVVQINPIDVAVELDIESIEEPVHEIKPAVKIETDNYVGAGIDNLIDSKVSTLNKYTNQGRLYRTLRFQDIIDDVEHELETRRDIKLPKGLLGGLIMHESFGNPAQINMGNKKCGGKGNSDGGAGLMMMQPGVAKSYGLATYEDASHSGADCRHGKKLTRLVEKYNHDYAQLSKHDDRFNPEKAISAGASYLADKYEVIKKKNPSLPESRLWAMTLSAYNQGRPAPNAHRTHYVTSVLEMADMYDAGVDLLSNIKSGKIALKELKLASK